MDGRRSGSQQKKKLGIGGMGGGGGIGGSIRSPLVKRDQHSQVVIRGWLFKLEGALAMKQWKKRWFVLSDFCLFYYKDSDEEKLLGSILLPSYKINPCISEDRISRKFAFKAEHHNMKTYYFATDSKESMSQWMNAMSLATIMQKDTTACDVLAERGYGSPVLLDDEESGFSSYRPRRVPHHHSSSNQSSLSVMNNNYHHSDHPQRHHARSHHHHPTGGTVYPENLTPRSREFENGYLAVDAKYPSRSSHSSGEGIAPRRHPGQPLYANAPPKPRRLTGTYQEQGGGATSEYPLDYSDPRYAEYYLNNAPYRAQERDASLDYSSEWPAGMPYQDNYVYGSGYYPTSVEQQREVAAAVVTQQQPRRDFDSNVHYHHPSGQPPRPHSADFLERQSVPDPSYLQPVPNSQTKPRQRPKSSLEQYDRRHYWDDEAAQVSDHGHNYSYDGRANWPTQGPPRRTSDYALQNLDTSRSPVSSSYSESPSSTLLRGPQPVTPAHPVPVGVPYDYGLPEIVDHDQIAINETGLKDATDTSPGLSKWPTMHPAKHPSPGYPVDTKYFAEPEPVVRRAPHGQRNRPLSAEYKLGDPSYNAPHPNYQQQEQMMADRDQKKVQLREESMKRLLEWKQRMLQSPLSRKYSPRPQGPGSSPRSSPSHSLSGRGGGAAQQQTHHYPPATLETSPVTPTTPPARPPLPEEYRQKVLQDLENHEARLMMQENAHASGESMVPSTYNGGGYGHLTFSKSSNDIENQPPYHPHFHHRISDKLPSSQQQSIYEKTPQHPFVPVISPPATEVHQVKPLQDIPPPVPLVTVPTDVNISIESSNDDKKFDDSTSKSDAKPEAKHNYKIHNQGRIPELRKSSASLNRVGHHPSYSSDDEDVVPYESPEDALRRISAGSSAPYYYSDLLPNGLRAPHPPDYHHHHAEFHVSPRSSRALLNNVRDVSPSHARGDIGRKVNVIQEPPVVLNNATVTEESVSVSMARELRASLEQLLSPESKKFLDAERNKYEAGHTLEKTHQSSTLSKLKKRSATPDFDHFYRNNEPEYENLNPGRNGSSNTLTRRLSRSLEGLVDLGPTGEGRPPPEPLMNQPTNDLPSLEKEEPYYENIDFMRKGGSVQLEESVDKLESKIPLSSPYKWDPDCPSVPTVSDSDVSLDAKRVRPQLIDPVTQLDDRRNSGGRTLVLNSLGDERDSDSEYLDENILRRESQRHFLAQGLGEKSFVGCTNKVKGMPVSPKQALSIPVNPESTNTIIATTRTSEEILEVKPRPSLQASIKPTDLESCPPLFPPDYSAYVSTDSSSSDISTQPKLADSVFGTSSVSDEQMGHRVRRLSGLTKDGLNSSDSELHKQTSSKVRRLIQRSQGLSREGKRLSISAGDLLEKSHEELVLLLIQLRRTLARVVKTREKCNAQLESAQVISRTRRGSTDKSIPNWEELKAQIQELERQYDLTQPIVNLVENMVKLGSLYRGHEKHTLAASTAKMMSYVGQEQIYTPSQNLVEFSSNVVEQECSEPENLNAGMNYLYELNRGYHAESANLMSLHQDKDMLEWTLDSVKGKVSSAGDNTMLVQKLKKQQLLLEKELNRVHNLLAHSAAKIEELTKENSKQEKEIILLKQKVQQALKNSSLDKMPLARANLESELGRVQSVIEELAHQRTEVAKQVENLKLESQHSLSIRSPSLLGPPVRASPTGVAGSIPLPLRRKFQTTYFETDLDSFETRDLACIPSHIYFGEGSDVPLYANTVEVNDNKLGNESSVESPPETVCYDKNLTMSFDSAEADKMLNDFYSSQDINEADERMKRFYGILPREKPSEIKTVRIVKRESERRSRVRKNVSYGDNHSLIWLVEEPDTLLSEDGEETDDGVFQEPFQGAQNRPTTLFFPPQIQSTFPTAREQLFGGQTSMCSPSSSSSEFRTPITPLFLLNKQPQQYPATSQTTTTSTTSSSIDYRAPFKKAKRRHYTISGSQPTLEQSWLKHTAGGLRSRDDMDMERCLRTVNTPDIVRSTIKKVDVFDEKLIERELSLPQKIVIPERYIEVEPPEELSASEKLRRKLKAETIRKMLSETTTYEDIADENGPTETLRKKLDEEKKKRAHLLALNHTIAKEVMERSKMVAATHTSVDPPSTN